MLHASCRGPTTRDRVGHGFPATSRGVDGRRLRPSFSNRASMASSNLEGLAPMLAAVGKAVPAEPGWVFEPKYDGIRVLAFVDGDTVSLTTRNGIDRAAQFPEIVKGLRSVAARH